MSQFSVVEHKRLQNNVLFL